ncbi:ribosomal RNA processing protein 1 homolog B isoform X2 [Perognathus longimembris pacificus]|uniref:ribosomal RNA processing protein 1 homolog B isoform X2 n=1 Tax=Perognathus longimembris pacificus TaxID=214514 RepID=UPI002018488B|nr:ribosomal RNA processing protein 1 homolog B isoform X2 [Perognathus longimembris pacificus]
MAPAMQSAEIQFAQRLASGEKGVRDRAVKKLRQYLSVKTQRETGGFSQEELLKIWKGLFYCMWVQDKPLLQEELANTVSQLIHVVNNSEAQHLFIQTFWQTMNREWKGIDKLHLDKYYMLTRMVLRQSFEVLKRSGWEESRIKLFLDVLMKEILCPESQSPDGVRFHFIDIYLDELSTVGGKELLADQNLKFIDPFCKVAAKTKDHTLVQTIARGVFEAIVQQSPFIPEETGQDQGIEGNGKDSSMRAILTNGTAGKKVSGTSKTALDKCLPKREGDDGTAPEDPGPPLQFDYKAVADRLLEITNRKNTPPFNRKHLCKLIKKFQELSEGNVAQLSFAEDIAGEGDQALSQGKRKKKRKKLLEKANSEQEKGSQVFLAEEEDSEGSTQKRRRKKKKRNHLQPETRGLEDVAAAPAQSMDSQAEATKKQTLPAREVEPGAEAAPLTPGQSASEHPRPVPPHSQRTRPKQKSLQARRGTWEPATPPEEGTPQHPEGAPSCGLAQGPAAQGSPTNGARLPKRKRKLGALPVNGTGLPSVSWPSPPKASPGEGEEGQVTLPQCKRPQKKKAEPGSLLHSLSSQKTAVLKKRKKIKEISNLIEHNGMTESKVKQLQALGSSRALGHLKKQPLRTENDFVKFEVSHSPKPLFFRKVKGGTATRSPDPAQQECTPQHALPELSKTPTSSKKVTFGLNRNMTTEFKKTDKSILVSPTGLARVAFDPEQRPIHGVLKTPTSSPTITPLVTKMPLAATPKRRPRAADFF